METVVDELVIKLKVDQAQLSAGLANVNGELQKLSVAGDAAKADLERLSLAGVDLGSQLESVFSKASRQLGGAFEAFLKTGEFSFSRLRDIALSALNDIGQSLLKSGLQQIFGVSSLGGIFSTILSSFAGRETGGPVNAGRAFLVGERGPEIFIPPSGGRIAPLNAGQGADNRQERPVSVTVNINHSSPQPMGRESAGQVALAVRRAVQRAARDQ